MLSYLQTCKKQDWKGKFLQSLDLPRGVYHNLSCWSVETQSKHGLLRYSNASGHHKPSGTVCFLFHQLVILLQFLGKRTKRAAKRRNISLHRCPNPLYPANFLQALFWSSFKCLSLFWKLENAKPQLKTSYNNCTQNIWEKDANSDFYEKGQTLWFDFSFLRCEAAASQTCVAFVVTYTDPNGSGLTRHGRHASYIRKQLFISINCKFLSDIDKPFTI